MAMEWLFPHPAGDTLEEQAATMAQWLSADPAAAAIPAEEAEAFMTAGWLLYGMEPDYFTLIWRAFGLPTSDLSRKARRTATLRMMRRWNIPKYQQLLRRNAISTLMGPYLDPEMHPEFWTDERFEAALWDGKMLLVWVAQIYRYLHPGADVLEWIRSTAPELERQYLLKVDIARVALRRLVHADKAARTEAAPALVEELKGRDHRSGTLRQDVRRLEQERKRLRAEARRQEQEKRAALSQARGEVAAARRALGDQKAAWQRQLAEQARQHELEISRLQKRLAAARSRFYRELALIKAPLLQGRRVTVRGGDTESARVLVETLGGCWAPAAPAVTLSGEGGVVLVERQLQGLLLHGAEIHCDGSRRKVGRRPPIATAACQVYVGGIPVQHQRRVVCCGPAASSLMAEYGALVMALTLLASLGPARGTQVTVWSDCKYMVQHLSGQRPLRPEEMRGCRTLDRKVRTLLRRLERVGCQVRLQWVRRDRVETEDRLCELTYREADWYRRPPAEVPRLPLSSFLRSL